MFHEEEDQRKVLQVVFQHGQLIKWPAEACAKIGMSIPNYFRNGKQVFYTQNALSDISNAKIFVVVS